MEISMKDKGEKKNYNQNEKINTNEKNRVKRTAVED